MLAFQEGVSIEQAMSHDWTIGQAKALYAGVGVEQALSHDWNQELISCWQEFRSENFEQKCLGKQVEDSADL